MDGKSVKDQNFDRWLDLAMDARGNAEPRLGLEERVLARLAMETPRKSFIRSPLFAAVAAALVISFTLLVTIRKAVNPQTAFRTPETRMASRTLAPPGAYTNNPRVDTRRHRKHAAREVSVRHPGSEQQLPRLATFPSARPQTAQERLLARLAARRGSFEVASNSEEMVRLKDLSVPELSILPLQGTPPDKAPQY